jgi:hypothetical protein
MNNEVSIARYRRSADVIDKGARTRLSIATLSFAPRLPLRFVHVCRTPDYTLGRLIAGERVNTSMSGLNRSGHSLPGVFCYAIIRLSRSPGSISLLSSLNEGLFKEPVKMTTVPEPVGSPEE